MKTKFYTLGSKSEAEGLTPLTQLYDDNGNLVIGFQGDITTLYKIKEVTEKEFDALFGDIGAENSGAFGIVNEEGLALRQAQADKQVAAFNEVLEFEAVKIERKVAAGILMEDEIDQEVANKKLPVKVAENAKAKVAQKPR